jgi:acetylornithine/N-succinyldiaminopimelate aminotransferase
MSTAKQSQLLERTTPALMQNYRQPPLVMERGRGVELWDVAGRRYLDMTAGIAVCCLGHAHPRLTAAIAEQAGKLLHTSNLYYNEQQLLLAEELARISFADRSFFCNSGAEANEAAIKLARRYQRLVNHEDRNIVVSTLDSFHGRSVATVAITGQEKYRQDFGPLLEPVRYVPFDDLDAAARALKDRQACAFVVEPIQAEGGINVPSSGYLAGLRRLCDETGTLLVFDEVQTGIGRTGRWFGHEHEGVTPDVMTLAKALAGGVPIGAVLASETAAAGLRAEPGGPVPHASTFGGNPLACAAARTVIATIEQEQLLEHCAAMGAYLREQLAALASRQPGLCREVRGRGLLCGLRLQRGAAEVTAACRDRGLLVSLAGPAVVRFVPALNVQRKHLDEAVGLLEEAIVEVGNAG